MLGLVHRTVLGEGPEHFKQFFRTRAFTTTYWTRQAERRHYRQLEETYFTGCPELRRSSALGLAMVYNLLPKHVVEQTSVKNFQSALQELVLERALAGCA